MKNKYFYYFIFILSISIFIGILYDVIISTFHQADSISAVPNVFQHVQGKSFKQIIDFIFSSSPFTIGNREGSGEVYYKVYMTVIILFFGPNAKYFIVFSVLLHIINSGLLFLLSRKTGLNTKTSYFAALLYLNLFAHFESYLWPMAFQHLAVTFFILLVLNLYLKTDQLIDKGHKYHKYYFITLLSNLAASFCRPSILMLPASIFCHIIFSPKNEKERINKYQIWLPIFLTYLIYPLIRLTYVYDNQLSMLLTRLGLPMEYLPILIICLLFLISVWVFLKVSPKYYEWKKVKWIFIISLSFIFLLLLRNKSKILLLPYLGLTPYYYSLISFLKPFTTVLVSPKAFYHNHIQLQIDIFDYLFGLLFILIFIKKYVYLWRKLILLFVIYLICLIYIPSFLIPSRYFVYISPLFCISFCAVLVMFYDKIMEKTKLNIVIKDSFFIIIFIFLCIFNIIAIKLTMIKGDIDSTYFIYDDIRTAQLIKNDIKKYVNNPRGENIYINNALPLSYKETWDYDPKDIDTNEYYNLRFALVQIFNDNSMLNVKINKNHAGNGKYYEYKIDEDKIINLDGKNIDQFSNYFEEGKYLMMMNQNENAIVLFEKAIEERPFIIKYVLKKYALQDMFRITDGFGMHAWIKQRISYYKYLNYFTADKRMPEKADNISNIIEKEITDFAQCIFYLSYLEYSVGNIKESEEIYTKLQYLETDSENLYEWLYKVNIIKNDQKMLSFMNDYNYILSDRVVYQEKNEKTYRFSKFIMKLLFNIDICIDLKTGHLSINKI
jgi:tetratricopeptide (TPR) repeat protein